MEKPVPLNTSETVIGNWSNKIQYLEGILPECNFRIDSYQICKNWLKARNGNPLDNEDTQRYQRIVVILKEIDRLMEGIKSRFQSDQLKKLEIFEKVRAIVVEKLEIEPVRVTYIANFVNNLGADSLETVEIVMALEETFEIEIPVEIAKTLLTVQQAIDYISQTVEVAV